MRPAVAPGLLVLLAACGGPVPPAVPNVPAGPGVPETPAARVPDGYVERLDDRERERLRTYRDIDERIHRHGVQSLLRRDVTLQVLRDHFGGRPARGASPRLAAALAGQELARARDELGAFVADARSWGRTAFADAEGRVTDTFTAWFSKGYAVVEASCVVVDEEWRVDALTVTREDPPKDAARPDASVPASTGVRPVSADGLVRQTCRTCEGVRFAAPGAPWREVALDAGCTHLWRDGASRALREAVRDGTVVLLRRGGRFAAVRLDRQASEPERVAFTWVARADGGASLDPADSAVRSGETRDAESIQVGDLRVDWSVAGDGSGWLYHARSPGETAADGDVRLCVTDLRSFDALDAADERWVYRASLTDEGVRGR